MPAAAIRDRPHALHSQSVFRHKVQSSSFRGSFSVCLFVESLNCESERVTVRFARALTAVRLSGGFLRGLRSPALDRLAEQPVPRYFKSPIGDLEFHENAPHAERLL